MQELLDKSAVTDTVTLSSDIDQLEDVLMNVNEANVLFNKMPCQTEHFL